MIKKRAGTPPAVDPGQAEQTVARGAGLGTVDRLAAHEGGRPGNVRAPSSDVADTLYGRDFAERYMVHITALEKGLALVTAALALATGVLGYKTATINQAKDQAQAAAVSTNNDLSSLQAEFDALQGENARLKAQLGLPGPTADIQTPTAATVRHSGQLVLADDSGADLDSPSSNPQWNTDALDIGNAYPAIQVYTTALYLGDKRADYETCRNTTGYSDEGFDTGSVAPGAYICVKTNEGRYSALRITQLDSSKITFDVVTYNPPDN